MSGETKAYLVIHEGEARAGKLRGYEGPARSHFDDTGWLLYRVRDGKPTDMVFCDRMEPEDATLVRDLRPMVEELNRIAAQRSALYAALEEMTSPRRTDCNDRKCGSCSRCRALAALALARGEEER